MYIFWIKGFQPCKWPGAHQLRSGIGFRRAWAASALPTLNWSNKAPIPLSAGGWLKLRKSGGVARGGNPKVKVSKFVMPAVGVAGGLLDTFDDSHDLGLAGRGELTGSLLLPWA